MRVAIIGAGISGLSCAFELEKAGITPVIYEKRGAIGDALDYSSIWSNLISRVNRDPLEYLSEKYNFCVNPLFNLREKIMISPNKKTIAKGNLGYIFKRGLDPYSLEKQIASKISTPVRYNSYVDSNDIRKEFEHIVVATATASIAKQLNVWKDSFITQIRVAVVLGDFKVDSSTVWFNEKYANKSFGYLIPNNSKEATLALIINNSCTDELDHYWKTFLSIENIQYKITHQYDTEYLTGLVRRHKINNIYLVGNAAGFTDDLIGVGAFNAIESGILAAQSIINGSDYNDLAKPIYDDIMKLDHFRQAMNSFDNSDFDKLIGFLKTPGIKQLIYNNPFFKLRHGLPVVKLYNSYKSKKR